MTYPPGGQDGPDFDQAHDAGTGDEEFSPKTNRRLWFWFLLIAFVIFECTANPALAVAFGCIKFGWGDFRRARRLKRDDLSRVRGRVCARFSTAWGLIKVSLVATVLMFAIANVQMRQAGQGGKPAAGPGKEPPATFVAAGILAMTGLGLSALVATPAVVSSLRHGLKVWVGSRLNRAKLVLASAILTWVTALGLALLLVALASSQKADLNPVQFLCAFVVVMFGIPISILVLLGALERRIVAKTPGECWGQLPAHLLKALTPDDWERDEARGFALDPSGRPW